jgi:hypothetical protein
MHKGEIERRQILTKYLRKQSRIGIETDRAVLQNGFFPPQLSAADQLDCVGVN